MKSCDAKYPGLARSFGHNSLAAMVDGTFHGGLNTMLSTCDCSIGVSSPGRPVTARIDRVGVSEWNTVSTAAAMFTWIRSTGSTGGNQRQRSILARIWSIRRSTGVFRAASVAAFTRPSSCSP